MSLFCSKQTGSSLAQNKTEAGPAVIAVPGATIIAEPGATTVAEPGATIIALLNWPNIYKFAGRLVKAVLLSENIKSKEKKEEL